MPQAPLGATSTRCFAQRRKPRPTLLRRAAARRSADRGRARWSSARRSPGCSGPSSSTTTTSAHGWSGDPRSRRRRERAARPQRRLAAPRATATSSRCRTSGSIPGSRPGTSRSTASPLALVDPEFAKEQLVAAAARVVHAPERPDPGLRVGLRRRQSAGARLGGLRVYQIDGSSDGGDGDRDFLERVFHKLLLNFTWWVNRKDAEGNNVFQGGFLGLDNIGVFDRIAAAADRRLPRAGRRHGLDGAVLPEHAARSRSSWRRHDPAYEDIAHQVLRALPGHRRRDEHVGERRRSGCGTRRTGSSTTCCDAAERQRRAAARCARWSG